MNFSAILFRDIKLLPELIKYITVVWLYSEQRHHPFFVFFFEQVPQVLCLTRCHGHPTRGRKVRERYHRLFTLSNAPKVLNPLFISTARLEKASLRRAATYVVELWPGVADCCTPLPVSRSFCALFSVEE